MKKTLFLLVISTLLITSCTKENISLMPRYHEIQGIWNLQSVSFDSAGIKISVQLKDRLRIEEDLSYALYIRRFDFIENGAIDVVDQNSERLELSFLARYPEYSSYAGSHIFGYFNLELVSLSESEMILKTIRSEEFELPEREYYFTK